VRIVRFIEASDTPISFFGLGFGCDGRGQFFGKDYFQYVHRQMMLALIGKNKVSA